MKRSIQRIMKKMLLVVLTFLIITIQTGIVSAEAIKIVVNGQLLPLETQAEVRDERVMLQMNEALRMLDAAVVWDETSRSASVTIDSNEYTIYPDQGIVVDADEVVVQIQPQPYISSGRIMVPLRFMSELMGAEVQWNAESRSVLISKPVNQSVNGIEVLEDEQELTVEESDETATLLFLDEAVNLAVNNSYSLRNRLISINQLEESRERSAETYMNTRPEGDAGWVQDIQNKQALLGLLQTEINLEISRLQAEIDEERIEYTVLSIFYDIIQMENDLKALDDTLLVRELDYRHQQLRVEQGLISQVALNASAEELGQLRTRRDSLNRSLSNVYEQLGIMTGISDIQNYRVEQIPLEYEVMGEVNLTTHTSRKINADPYIKLQERQIEKAERNLQLFVYTGMEEPYEVRRLTLESEKNSLSDLKNKLRESLQNRLASIRQLENQYLITFSELAVLEDQLRVIKTQWELGMVTEKDVLQLEANLQSRSIELMRIAHQHELLSILFDAPYLAPDYLN